MHCWARYLFIAVVTVLGIGQMIAACGQKGDLYLPEPQAKEKTQAHEEAGEGQQAKADEELELEEEPEVEQEITDVPEIPAPGAPAKAKQ